jgi:hypothetical protein
MGFKGTAKPTVTSIKEAKEQMQKVLDSPIFGSLEVAIGRGYLIQLLSGAYQKKNQKAIKNVEYLIEIFDKMQLTIQAQNMEIHKLKTIIDATVQLPTETN